jgi:N-dimethylarginine dimethylaminohydrolase
MSRDKVDNQTIAMTDQLTAAVKEVFQERGYHHIEVSIAEESKGNLTFQMGLQGGQEKLTEEEVDSAITEALHRIGATIKDEE